MTCVVCAREIDPATAPIHPTCEPKRPTGDAELLVAVATLVQSGLVTP